MPGFVDLGEESCEIDPAIADELFIAELEVEEPCDESNDEGTEEESEEDDLSRCAGAEEGSAQSCGDTKTKSAAHPRNQHRSSHAVLGPVRMRSCRCGQLETRVVDFAIPNDARAAARADAASDAASGASTPAAPERRGPLLYKVAAAAARIATPHRDPGGHPAGPLHPHPLLQSPRASPSLLPSPISRHPQLLLISVPGRRRGGGGEGRRGRAREGGGGRERGRE